MLKRISLLFPTPCVGTEFGLSHRWIACGGLAFPTLCAQIVPLLYNLVDRICIGQMSDGALAMAAIGICAPIVTVVTAFTGMFGRGGLPHAAIRMGKRDNRTIEKFLGNSLSMLFVTSVLITAGVLLWKTPLLRLFGASDRTLPCADNYLTVYILGTVFVQVTVGMNYYITSRAITAGYTLVNQWILLFFPGSPYNKYSNAGKGEKMTGCGFGMVFAESVAPLKIWEGRLRRSPIWAR